MKYKCLILDHDDTIVNSTATIHYPAFQEYMKLHHPDIHFTAEEYFALNFDPGVIALFRDICGMSEEEMKQEEEFWFSYVKTRIPLAYDGLREILWKQKNEGGLICVISHSYTEYILRDYSCNSLPEPDLIFGWDMPKELRKPHPYSIYEIEKRFRLSPEDILVIDDLKPGYDMAKAAGVPFAAAGWAYNVPSIETFMRSHCSLYFKTVQELAAHLNG